jgi:putative transposase
MAEQNDELRWRRQAIRLRLKGRRPCDIGKRIPHKREWLRKWWLRFTDQGWQGLHEHSRRPIHSPQAYDQQAHTVVIAVRRALEQRQVGLIGARAVHQEIKRQRLLQNVPSLATIKRWLHLAGITPPTTPQRPAGYYPQPEPPEQAVWHACDWLARYLEGGTKIFVFHTVDLQTHALAQTLRTDKTVTSVQTHLLETWQTLGLPHRLHLDNDAAFTGGERTARRFGMVVRLCLYVGIELVFLPPGEPKRNGLVERVNGLWVHHFWERNRFQEVGEVVRQHGVFLDWYWQEYTPPTLCGQTPAQAQAQVKRTPLARQAVQAIPAVLPITAGRVHFVRRVGADGTIHILGETWKVSRGLAQEYVWATVMTDCQRMEVYHQRSKRATFRLVKTFDYQLPEKVFQLRPEFKR